MLAFGFGLTLAPSVAAVPCGLGVAPPPWIGVKVVADTLLAAQAADPNQPIAVSAGAAGTIHVEWGQVKAANLTEFSSSGDNVGTLIHRTATNTGRGGATLRVGCDDNRPLLVGEATMGLDSVTEIRVWPLGGNTDYGPQSRDAVLTPIAPDQAIMAGRVRIWEEIGESYRPWEPFVALIKPSGNGFITYNAPPLDDDADWWKGRRFTPPAEDFTVTAAAARPGGGFIFGGTMDTDEGRSLYVYVLDSNYEFERSLSAPLDAASNVTSVLESSDGDIVVCGTNRASKVVYSAFIAKFEADSDEIPELVSSFPVSESGGCALLGQHQVLMSGAHWPNAAGIFKLGQSDLFLATYNIDAEPSLEQSATYGSTSSEKNVSPPLVLGGSSYVAGITSGTWGQAVGGSPGKVFLVKLHNDTLALY